jgi:hypothetical protein
MMDQHDYHQHVVLRSHGHTAPAIASAPTPDGELFGDPSSVMEAVELLNNTGVAFQSHRHNMIRANVCYDICLIWLVGPRAGGSIDRLSAALQKFSSDGDILRNQITELLSVDNLGQLVALTNSTLRDSEIHDPGRMYALSSFLPVVSSPGETQEEEEITMQHPIENRATRGEQNYNNTPLAFHRDRTNLHLTILYNMASAAASQGWFVEVNCLRQEMKTVVSDAMETFGILVYSNKARRLCVAIDFHVACFESHGYLVRDSSSHHLQDVPSQGIQACVRGMRESINRARGIPRSSVLVSELCITLAGVLSLSGLHSDSRQALDDASVLVENEPLLNRTSFGINIRSFILVIPSAPAA